MNKHVLPIIEPRSEYLSEFAKMGIVAWYDLKRDRGNKVFNLMGRSRDFANLVADSPLGIDTNSDGKSDGWTIGAAGGCTGVFSIENGKQKMDLTASTGGNQTLYCYKDVSTSPGEVVSCSVDYDFTELTGTVIIKVYLRFLKSDNTVISGVDSNIITSSGSGTLIALNKTAPAETAKVRFEIDETTSPDAGTGTVWFKNARLVKAATLNHTGNTHGIVTGATAHPCGKSFDGVDDYVTIPNDEVLNFSNQLSLGAFVKYDVLNASHILGKSNDSAATTQYCLFYNITTKTFDVVLNGTGRTHTTTQLESDKWYFVMATWDGNNVKIYHNGCQEGATVSYSTPLFSSPNIRIGKREGSGASMFKGVIGDSFYANRALTPSQVKQVYNMFAWQYPGLAIAG